MSLARFLVYSNQFDLQGICATTSTWLQNQTHIDIIHNHIAEYAKIYDNLSAHQPDTEDPWPTADELLAMTYAGPPVYGLQGVGEGQSTNGSIALRTTVEQNEAPTWVVIWGGANVLAQAVWEYEQNHTQAEIDHFISKLRVYSISDQDNSGARVRRRHPEIFWILSLHTMNIYQSTTWQGISSPGVDQGGPDNSIVSNDWLQTNIRDVSSFGSVYPDVEFIMEGDSPTFLYLSQNGLGSSEHPCWGSWGGRYGRITDEDHIYTDTVDTNVRGLDGNHYTSGYASVWRWRNAYQWDFSGRMHWTSTSNFSAVNHNPVVVVNDSNIVAQPLFLNVTPGEIVFLDASASYDPDVNSSSTATSISSKGFANITFWQYVDASAPQSGLNTAPSLKITQDGLTATVAVPALEDIPSAWIQGLRIILPASILKEPLLWDILMNLRGDYQIIVGPVSRRHASSLAGRNLNKMIPRIGLPMPTVVYFISRIVTLGYLLSLTLFMVAPVQCTPTAHIVGVTSHLSMTSTGLLFFFRVSALYHNHRYIRATFFSLWISLPRDSPKYFNRLEEFEQEIEKRKDEIGR
ncbi:hypothetical protein D9758_005017 [Tetrapyrgos nigripes]|uniref:Cellulose-binding Sde182 nucleoside hydrolase-like domain-containing protein n=1 Tax=Tetrapyrgos nigripes TaxID=182062 RepID=A0A8H5GWI4_9AGAR|nr:hypothetical protein D9758_005017 [Tetrapyrgos nigripes]